MIEQKDQTIEKEKSHRETSEVCLSGTDGNISYLESKDSSIISEENSEKESTGKSLTESEITNSEEDDPSSNDTGDPSDDPSHKRTSTISKFKLRMRALLNNWKTQLIGAILTFYILFANDIKMLTTDYTADDGFSIICIVLMFLFCMELVISCIVIEGYLFSFYFWLDFVSIFSFLLDVHWFYDYIIYAVSGKGGGNNKAQSVTAIVNASRGAKVGARAIRIIRVLKTLKTLRISKLYIEGEKMIELNVNKELMMKKAKSFKNRKSYLVTFKQTDNKYNDNNDEIIPRVGGRIKINNSNNNHNIQNETVNSLKINTLQQIKPEYLKKASVTKFKKISDHKEFNAKMNSDKVLRHIKHNENIAVHKKILMKTNIIHNKGAFKNEIEKRLIEENLFIRKGHRDKKTIKMTRNFKLPQHFYFEKNEVDRLEQKENDVIIKDMIDSNKNNTKEIDAVNNTIADESKVGRKLSDKNSQRVIIIILSVMFAIILFDSSLYVEIISSMDMGIEAFNDFNTPYDYYFNFTFDIYVKENLNTSCPVIFAQVGNLTYGDLNDTSYLRECEKTISTADCSNFNNLPVNNNQSNEGFACVAIFDNRSFTKLTSLLNIIKTIFIFLVLAGSIYYFNKDTTDMVLEPIESMVMKINEISKNPLDAMQINERAELAKLIAEEETKTKKSKLLANVSRWFCMRTGDDKKKPLVPKNSQPLETVILEDTITKIGALLALGFGEAGCEIISKNMQNNSKGEINPILPGKKVIAIYGFCDIRNFTDTTEVLKEKVMIFVNEIAEIVHEITAEYCGSANKNIGDAFLLVWKFEEEYLIKEEDGKISLKNCPAVNQICDLALVSFIKIIAKIQTSNKLDKYRKISGLSKIIKDYQVKMGFGLHLGWSIEGAIGSSFKIDASYLSPHVNMASKLEEKTKEYGVNLVMSEDFVKYLSDAAKNRTRVIDVNLADNGESKYIYTVDLDLNSLKIEEIENEDNLYLSEVNDKDNLIKHISNKKMEKYKKRIKRRKNYEDAVNCKIDVWKNFEETDEDFFIMRKKFSSEFYTLYNKGFLNYINGDWMEAKLLFEKAEFVLGERQYLSYVLNYMRHHNFVRPADWKGNSGESGH